MYHSEKKSHKVQLYNFKPHVIFPLFIVIRLSRRFWFGEFFHHTLTFTRKIVISYIMATSTSTLTLCDNCQVKSLLLFRSNRNLETYTLLASCGHRKVWKYCRISKNSRMSYALPSRSKTFHGLPNDFAVPKATVSKI